AASTAPAPTSPPAAPAPAPAPAPARPTTYKIKSGDTLTAIAKKFNTTVTKLAQLNNIADPNFIIAGRTLKLP
ncbi:MAG: LysM peptidoglycan-binding domain-containing protein, partial [Thermoleophilia bacterium]|nr:LysM peptidoglycan-binding domain-containing protein [Thermoleophilia bacterium]